MFVGEEEGGREGGKRTISHHQPGKGSRVIDIVHEYSAVDGRVVFEHVGIASADIVTEVEMDGAACLLGEKKSATKRMVSWDNWEWASRFKHEWSDFVGF